MTGSAPSGHVGDQLSADDQRLAVQLEARARRERQRAGGRQRRRQRDAALDLEVREHAGWRCRHCPSARCGPSPTIVWPASALLVTVSVKPFVSSVRARLEEQVADGDVRGQRRNDGGCRGEVDARCSPPARRAGSSSPGCTSWCPAPFHSASKPTGDAGLTWIDSVCSIPPLRRAAVHAFDREFVVARRRRRARQRAARAQRDARRQTARDRERRST